MCIYTVCILNMNVHIYTSKLGVNLCYIKLSKTLRRKINGTMKEKQHIPETY